MCEFVASIARTDEAFESERDTESAFAVTVGRQSEWTQVSACVFVSLYISLVVICLVFMGTRGFLPYLGFSMIYIVHIYFSRNIFPNGLPVYALGLTDRSQPIQSSASSADPADVELDSQQFFPTHMWKYDS